MHQNLVIKYIFNQGIEKNIYRVDYLQSLGTNADQN